MVVRYQKIDMLSICKSVLMLIKYSVMLQIYSVTIMDNKYVFKSSRWPCLISKTGAYKYWINVQPFILRWSIIINPFGYLMSLIEKLRNNSKYQWSHYRPK